jgi:hypothetical protein
LIEFEFKLSKPIFEASAKTKTGTYLFVVSDSECTLLLLSLLASR